MNTRKHLVSAAQLVLPTIGLSLISAGAYIKSIQSGQLQVLRDIFTYLFIILGFLLVITGVLWSVGRGMKNVLLKFSARRCRDVQVFTVDRFNCPPSYEESEARNNAIEVFPAIISISTVSQRVGPAPPVYTQTSYDNSFEDFSYEEPPSYQQAVFQSQAESQAAYLPTSFSTEPL